MKLMNILSRTLIAVGALTLVSASALAQNASQQEQIESIRQVLLSTQPNLRVGDIVPSPIDGLYEISIQNGQTIFASADARYLIPGDLYEFRAEGLVNLGEQRRDRDRAQRIAALNEADMVVYEAEGERKATLTVFTDVDCPYCRKLHADVPELNKLGIAVRYLGFPRTGLNTETHQKMISTWCAENPKVAMTSAKRGGAIPDANCDNPIASQYQLGREVGVTGTPALVLEDGTILPGYIPVETLSGYLLGTTTP